MTRTPACLVQTVAMLILLVPTSRAETPRTDDHGDPLPPGAVARLGTLRLRHPFQDIFSEPCVAFSPDGRTLVSGGGCDLRAWDVATGKDLGWFPTDSYAHAVQFSRDGKSVLTVDNSGSIRNWQAGAGNLLREMTPPDIESSLGPLSSFLSANGKVAGATSPNRVRLWEMETGKQILNWTEQVDKWFYSAALSPDGKMLVVTGKANRARLIDVPSGHAVRQIEGLNRASHLLPDIARERQENLYWFAFSPDGKTLAGVSGTKTFSVWNVADGRRRYTVKGCQGRLAFSPDGKYLVCGGEGEMRLFMAETGKEVRRFEPFPGTGRALVFSPDGKTLASVTGSNVNLWDVATGKRLHPFSGHESPAISLAFSPDGRSLASGDREGGTLIVWSLGDRKPRLTYSGDLPAVLSLAYSPDGKVLATGDGHPTSDAPDGPEGYDAQIRLWDLSAKRLLRQFPGHLNGVTSLAFSPDGKRLASGGQDARTRIWDVASGKRLVQIRGDATDLRRVAFSPDSKRLLVAGSPGELAIWRVDSGRKVCDLGPPGGDRREIAGAAFLPGGRTVFTCKCEIDSRMLMKAHRWDIETGRLLRSFSFRSPEIVPGTIAISPDGNTLAVAGSERDPKLDPSIHLWDMRTGKQVGRLRGSKVGITLSLAFSPDGKRLASGGLDTTILIWDVTFARLEQLWSDLAGGKDEGTLARKQLVATPEDAIPFLQEHLRRAAAAEDRASRLIGDLDNEDFQVREKASKELERLGAEVVFPFRLALQGTPSPEVRLRIQALLSRRETPPAEHDLQPRSVSLAILVLEEIGTPDARRVLEGLAKGPANSVVTRETGAALKRVTGRRKP